MFKDIFVYVYLHEGRNKLRLQELFIAITYLLIMSVMKTLIILLFIVLFIVKVLELSVNSHLIKI
jgi:hypothetical protein